MPRLAPLLLHQARRQSRHLVSLVTECRDVESARNELRWLSEHAQHVVRQHRRRAADHNALLAGFVRRRARGEPLQYIIGDQPFGELDILCRPGVLIPRPETETYCRRIASLLEEALSQSCLGGAELRVLDLCSGTGCIGLLLHSLLRPPVVDPAGGILVVEKLSVTGLDVSDLALELARRNVEHNIRRGLLHAGARHDITFRPADLLAPAADEVVNGRYDVVMANPPYISPADYAPGGRVTRSVRKYEPLLALVPPPPPPHTTVVNAANEAARADTFYARILHVGRLARAGLICMEVGDAEQAARVVRLAGRQFSMPADADGVDAQALVEVWCDDEHVSQVELPHLYEQQQQQQQQRGCERAVVVWTGAWARWRRRQLPI